MLAEKINEPVQFRVPPTSSCLSYRLVDDELALQFVSKPNKKSTHEAEEKEAREREGERVERVQEGGGGR
jgi:hypothetical protein